MSFIQEEVPLYNNMLHVYSPQPSMKKRVKDPGFLETQGKRTMASISQNIQAKAAVKK